MIRRILLDIDDVCNKCSMYALKWLGVPFDYSNFYTKYPTVHGYDIVTTANEMLGYERFDVKSFWSMIPRNFWASCPMSDEYPWLFQLCVDLVGQENVCFLTGPTKDPDCLAGKLEWINRFTPEFMHRQYLIGPRKQFCAHHEALLVDDSDANIDKFREWGGNGILVPRPWNTLNAINTKQHVIVEFGKLFQEKREHDTAYLRTAA
jgi:hypothetical protein